MSPPHVLSLAIYSQEAAQALAHLRTTFRAWITDDCGATEYTYTTYTTDAGTSSDEKRSEGSPARNK